MPPRPQRLAPALLAVALAGCCIRQPSSVDAVAGDWINLAELPGLPSRKLVDGGQPPGKAPAPPPSPVSGETGTSPLPVVPVAGIPDNPDKGFETEKPKPVAGSGGTPPEPVAVVGDGPGRAAPVPGPSPFALPNPGQPASSPLAEGQAVIPSLAALGQRAGAGGAGVALADAPGRADGQSRPPALPGLAGLPSAGASPRPSLGGASFVEVVPAPAPSPAIGGLAAQGDSAASRAALPRVPAEQSNEADGSRGFSLGILPGQTSRFGGQVVVAPSLGDSPAGSGAIGAAAPPLPNSTSPSRLNGSPSLGLFGGEADPKPPAGQLGGASLGGDSPRPGSSTLRINSGALVPSAQETPSKPALPGPQLREGASAPSVFGQLLKAPRSIRPPDEPATASAAAPVRPRSPEVSPRGAAASGSGSPGLSKLPSGAATASTPQQPLRAAAPSTAPVAVGSNSPASVPSPRVSPPAKPTSTGPSSGADFAHAQLASTPATSPEPRPAPIDASPRAPRVADDAQLAQRRLEELREEYAAYEREAARLRSVLRRALGLDEPENPEPEGGEPIRLNADGK